ncbi:phage tail protein [Chitinophaga polysaccharea]|uniref:phage tail protein n=1 Tax=Chitinophaga TaxID=79328 RepID=UPI00145503B2|nr:MULTISPECIES: tail fiber protein [Chitinophaga]NLR59162.1 phage tail protein [Chitinophaga polysaccharea]NLU92068.1 phage tail protein [Chitinophaga sp. Ak27]
MPLLGEIKIFAGNFAPVGWAFCDGSLLPISENDTLYNLIGTAFGGDGQQTFALPNLQSRVPMHQDAGHLFADAGGSESVILMSNHVPAHSHPVTISAFIPALGENPGPLLSPDNNYPAVTAGNMVYSTTTQGDRLKPLTVAPITPPDVNNNTFMMTVQPSAWAGQPKENRQPYLAVNFIISLFGEYPVPG